MPYYTVMVHIILHGLPVKGDGVGRRCRFLISEEELNADYIIPAAFDERVGGTVAKAVAEAARKSGVARL